MAPPSSCDILKHRYINHKQYTVLSKERGKNSLSEKKLQVPQDDVFQVVSWNSNPSAQQQYEI